MRILKLLKLTRTHMLIFEMGYGLDLVVNSCSDYACGKSGGRSISGGSTMCAGAYMYVLILHDSALCDSLLFTGVEWMAMGNWVQEA